MKYKRKSRLTSRQQTKLIEHFVAGTTARAASEIMGIQANTSISFYMRLRSVQVFHERSNSRASGFSGF